MKEVVVGIDIGGTYTKFGLIDKEGNALCHSKISSTDCDTIEGFVANLSQSIQKSSEGIEEDFEIKGIGIGAPNANYYKGTIEQAPNLVWKGVVPIVDTLKKVLSGPTCYYE